MSADTDQTAVSNGSEMDGNTNTDTPRGVGLSDGEYAETPVDRLKETSTGHDVHISEWADHHGVMHWMIPFPHREDNPVELGKQLTEKINSLKDTAATFTRQEMIGEASREVAEPLLYAHKAVKTDYTERRKRFLNPNYIHYDFEIDPIQTDESRREFYTRYIDIGTVSPNWIANHFDITTSGLRWWVNKTPEYQHAPRKRLAKARERIGKTAITLAAWDGYTRTDVSKMLGIPTSTLKGYVYRVDDNWSPPKSPAGKRWFGAGRQSGGNPIKPRQQDKPTSPDEVW